MEHAGPNLGLADRDSHLGPTDGDCHLGASDSIAGLSPTDTDAHPRAACLAHCPALADGR